VNVLLGLGLPWVIATTWEAYTPKASKSYEANDYFVPSATLGFTVIVFVCVAILAILLLLVRRYIVGGELGGSLGGRILSASLLMFLWCIYILLSIFQSVNIGGIGDQTWGIDISCKNCINPNP
jgi:energy-coupling factor transporter transmembrane protein EcfT